VDDWLIPKGYGQSAIALPKRLEFHTRYKRAKIIVKGSALSSEDKYVLHIDMAAQNQVEFKSKCDDFINEIREILDSLINKN